MAPLFVKLTHIKPWLSEELIVALGMSERRITGYLLLGLAGQCLALRLQCCSGVIGGYKGYAELPQWTDGMSGGTSLLWCEVCSPNFVIVVSDLTKSVSY